MAYSLSSQCVAIAVALSNNTLRVVRCWSERFQEPYWSIEDQHGVIEVALSAEEAYSRILEIRRRAGL